MHKHELSLLFSLPHAQKMMSCHEKNSREDLGLNTNIRFSKRLILIFLTIHTKKPPPPIPSYSLLGLNSSRHLSPTNNTQQMIHLIQPRQITTTLLIILINNTSVTNKYLSLTLLRDLIFWTRTLTTHRS